MRNHNHSVSLEVVNEQLITLSIDTERLAMALQAVQTDNLQSKGIINAVIISLFSNVALTKDMSEMMDGLLSDQSLGGNDHKSNLTTNHMPNVKSKASKLNLLSDFFRFMVWVIVIGLLLSPFACQQPVILDKPLAFEQTDNAEGVSDD